MDNNTCSSQQGSVQATLRLTRIPGVGPIVYSELVQYFGSASNVFKATAAELEQLPGIGPKLVNSILNTRDFATTDSIIERCQTHGIDMIERYANTYPERLSEIYDPPSILYSRGKLLPADNLSIAIVGSRHATRYGIKIASRLARGLSMAGITIISGLARGIDAAAHQAALEAGGRTIAVLGGGHLKLYPADHAALANEITHQGAVISESPPDTPPRSGSFPRRNRIVSGLSLGVVVVEAAQRSGALISARLAMEQGREVFAVPGPINSRMSKGCHKLIQDGAKLVSSVDDVLDELGPLATPIQTNEAGEIRNPAELKLTEQERNILNTIETTPTSIDSIIERTNIPAARVMSTISILEMRSLIQRVSGNLVARR
ncbi:MAG: DNA-protecting protein DprA [Planctomycetaceae bacterium]|nr:DNA-protecting protein DprA [Planctomycetaceae bacterium]MCP4480959.1 DNA-protecting protein DprA [Planctomycetaceae bacterium]MCP4773537.1 DNA-protecting protein DprA [Planctomycetaceae bacterium]